MNKTELAYSQQLNLLIRSGEIESWAYEPETLKLGPDCRYTPDFRIIRSYSNKPLIDPWDSIGKKEKPVSEPLCENSLIVEFHEVKGTLSKEGKPYIEDDALVKIKAASALHPYKFVIVWRHKGSWMSREI